MTPIQLCFSSILALTIRCIKWGSGHANPTGGQLHNDSDTIPEFIPEHCCGYSNICDHPRTKIPYFLPERHRFFISFLYSLDFHVSYPHHPPHHRRIPHLGRPVPDRSPVLWQGRNTRDRYKSLQVPDDRCLFGCRCNPDHLGFPVRGTRYTREAIVTGIVWLIANWALDLIVLVGMFGMNPGEWAASIGLRYLMIPVMVIMAGIVADEVLVKKEKEDPDLKF